MQPLVGKKLCVPTLEEIRIMAVHFHLLNYKRLVTCFKLQVEKGRLGFKFREQIYKITNFVIGLSATCKGPQIEQSC